MRFTSVSRVAGLVLGLGALTFGGCALETSSDVAEQGGPAVNETVGSVQQAICDPIKSDFCCDSTKYASCNVMRTPGNTDFEIKIYHCPETVESTGVTSWCAVEPGWTLIGGGGAVVGADPTKGAIVVNRPEHLFPDDLHSLQTYRSWEVYAVGRERGTKVSISAWAIGIKMAGYDNVKNLSPIHLSWSDWTQPFTSRPQSRCQVPAGQILLSGGWDSGFDNDHRIWVVDSFPDGMRNGSWIVNGSDLGHTFVDSVQASCISIEPCPSRWSSCFSDRRISRSTSSVGTGMRLAAAITPDGFLTTGVGFSSSSWYAPMYSLFPYNVESAPQGAAIAGVYPFGNATAAVTAFATALAR